MKELAKDSEIRLFGKKIALPEKGRVPPAIFTAGEDSGEAGGGGGFSDENSSGSDHEHGTEGKTVSKGEEEEDDDEVNKEADEAGEDKDEEMQENNEDCLAGELCEAGEEQKGEESQNPDALLESDENSRKPQDNKDSTAEPSKNEKDQGDGTNSQQKPLKKPDKILPCPRCNSMDTKFCYYNNYNVNQPRHFCKSCQRYWTAGGTMRNVPVGAGRRKNKNSASHCRHISISEALQAAQIDVPNGYHHPTFNTKGTVLSFGPDSPLCESMASVLNVTEKKAPNGTRNGYYKLEKGMPIPGKGGENGDDCSSGSSVTTSNSMVNGGKNGPQEPVVQNMNGFPSPIPCLPGVPWPFPWNPAVPVPAICPPGFPMPFYPAPYWNCSVPGPWSIPWLSSTSPTASQKASSSGPNSPTLGKHSRDGELIQQNTPEGKQSSPKKSEASILVPKTLRIDDPDEAAKSSIWATLGIKYDSVNKGGIFNAFQSKADEKKHVNTPSPVLQANPAALSRSLSFQETA